MHSLLRRRTARLFLAFCLLSALVWYLTTRAGYPSGFTARYYEGPAWSGPAKITTVDDRVTTSAVKETWRQAGQPFSVRWAASLVVSRATTARFSVLATGTARLFVDDRLVVDCGVLPGPRRVTSDVRLERGVHELRVEYAPSSTDPLIELTWAPGPLHRLMALTGVRVAPRQPSSSQAILREAIDAIRASIGFSWEFLYIALIVICGVVPAVRWVVRRHAPSGVSPPALWLLMVTGGLYLIAIDWGVPGPGWAPDELWPVDLFAGVDALFSNGWWSKYPPAHFYLSAILSGPFLVWHWLDPIGFAASLAPDVLVLMLRVLSVAMGVATVLIVYLCGKYLYGEWPSFVAAALAALTLPVVYYAKTANLDMPYVFWFAIALVSFARIVVEPARTDYLLFAVAATLSVCTKDQAYGLYALPGLALLSRGRPRDLLMATGVSLGLFIVWQNLPFNWSGFVTHVRYITSPGAQPFRMFASTVSGQWDLLQATLMLMRVSWGWPAALLCVLGLGCTLWRPGTMQMRLWWLLLPAVSYYVTFIAVVGYTYDRFLMPLFVVVALAGGLGAACLERIAGGRRVLRFAVAGVLAYSCAHAMTVNIAMLRDPRYDVEAWMRAHIEPDATIGVVGVVEHAPRIERWYTEFVDPTMENIQRSGFEYLVVNANWVERFAPDRLQHEGWRQLRDGRLKYQQVFEAHKKISFAGISLDARFDEFGATGYSTLTRLNPPITVYKRR